MMMKILTVILVLSISFVIKPGSEATNCVNGDIRLVGGRTALEGRVEVCSDMGAWNKVCKDGWDNNDAIVVCRQLGFSQVDSLALTRQGLQGFLNSTATRFLFNEVNCHGFEPRLIDCSSNRYAICDPSGVEDAGVRCTSIKFSVIINASYSDTSVMLSWNPVDNHVIKTLEVNCFYMYNNTTYAIQSTVSSNRTLVQLDRLAPSTLYNCCISANSSTTCIDVLTLASKKSESQSTECANGDGLAVGVLASLNALFIVLLILAAAALVYFITIILKQKKQINTSRNLNVKAHQCETEKNPSYSTGNIARNKYNQAMTSRIGNQIDSAKRKGEIQKTKKDPNEAASQRGYVKHPPKFTTEENITEMNPSYSTVPLPGVGEYSIIGPLYEKSDRKSHLSASLKATTDNRKGIRDSPKTSSFISSSRYVYRQQRESQDDKSAQAQPANLESNPAYSVLPGSDGEYSLVGPAYHKVSKAAASDVKAKHEYAEIKEANIDLESRESLQEKHSSSFTGTAYDGTGLNRDKMNPIQDADPKQPADILLVEDKSDGNEAQSSREDDDAAPIRGNKDCAIEGESF